LKISAGELPRRRFFRLARIAAAGDEELTREHLLRQGLNSTGTKSRIATAGTKYLAISLSPSVV
jgi:hypothetical protein